MTNKTKAMSKKNGLFAADGEYRIMLRKMKVKANRAKVRMFGMNLSIRESVLLSRVRFNTEFADDQIAFSFVTDVRVEQ